MVVLLHLADDLMESLSLFSIKSTKVLREVVRVKVQEVYFDAHSSSQPPEVVSMVLNNFVVVFSIVVAEKLLNHISEAAPCRFLLFGEVFDEFPVTQELAYLQTNKDSSMQLRLRQSQEFLLSQELLLFFFFFRLLPFRWRHSGCFETSARKIWQCFTSDALPDATYW